MTLGTLRKAVVGGDVTRGTVMAGQSAGLVKQEQTCSEMIEEIMDQAKTSERGIEDGQNCICIPGAGCTACRHGKRIL